VALERVVLEHGDGTGNLADLVHPLVAVDLDVVVAFGDGRERGRDRGQRLGDAAHDQQGQHQHQKCGNGGSDRHGLDRLRQHRFILGHRNSDIENADDFAGRIGDGVVGRHIRLAEQHGRALVGFAAAQDRLSGMVGGKLGADGAVTIFLLQVG
jgi:hypothetical protein